MEKELITTSEYLLYIDKKAEIKKGDYLLEKESIINVFPDYLTDLDECDKIIAYRKLNEEAKELKGLPLLPLLSNPIKSYRVGRKQKRAILDENGIEVVIFKTGNENEAQRYCDYLNGKYFSLEDIKNSITFGYLIGYSDGVNKKEIERPVEGKYFDEYIQSLSTQQLPKEFIPEYEKEIIGEVSGTVYIDERIKTITNSTGKIELVGTWKY